MEKIILCPNECKMKLLEKYEEEKSLHSTKFINMKEFIDNYFFKYDERSIAYLMDKYNYNIDTCKVYLNNLYFIDLDKKYKNKKLIFLQGLKKELIDNKLLTFNESFRTFVADKTIIAEHYFNLDKWLTKVLNYEFKIDNYNINKPIYKFNTLEDEVRFVCIKIRELLDKGININKIHLCNVDEEYYYTIDKLFGYFKIPINIPYKDSIYSSVVVRDYLNTLELDLDDPLKNNINKKIISVLSDLVYLDKDSYSYKAILEDKLKNTYMDNDILDNAVNIRDLYNYIFDDDDYVFVLGFNLDKLPKTYKDIDFISDKDKGEVLLYDSVYLNVREKSIVTYILSNIKNLYISYKCSSPFREYYPSNLIDDLGLEVISCDLDNYSYSDDYNKILLGEYLDKYYVYGEKYKDLDLLNSNYNINYNSYSNKFSGIDNDLYLKNLNYPLKLSYSSLNDYFNCNFKYYIKKVLKLGGYDETFDTILGSLFHYILSIYKRSDFDLDREWNKYLENKDLKIGETVFLVKIRKDIDELLSILKKQQLITGYDDELLEKEITIPIRNDISVELTGYIDKIMMYKKISDTYYSIIDYKTGYIDTHIEPLKYGLHLQLPVYLLLINKSKIFESPIFTGIYYQNILFNYPTWSSNLEKETNKRYMLKGYSSDEIDRLERFDSTYNDSELIYSMSYSEDKGFSRYTKLINDDTLMDLVNYTDNIVKDGANSIINGEFNINPKIYKDENACDKCKFRDLCFYTQDDVVLLDEVNDLSFLGGE